MPRYVPLGIWASSRRFRRQNSGGSTSSSNNNSNNLLWYRGEREMRHTEAGCLMAPMLLLPVFGSSLPLPVHLLIVFVHAFLVVPLVAGIYPPSVTTKLREKCGLLWAKTAKVCTVTFMTWKLYSLVAVVVAIKLYNRTQWTKYFNQIAFLHLVGLVDLYSATLWDVVKASVWNFLVCAGVYFIRESTGRRNRGSLYWSLGRSLLLLNMLPLNKVGGGNTAAVGLAYVLASEIYAQEGIGKAILLRMAKIERPLLQNLLNYWEMFEVLATSFLPTLSFYFWLQCDSRTSYLSLLALLFNFVLPLVCFLESLQDQMLLLLRLMESTTMGTGLPAGEFCTVCQTDIGRASVCAKTMCGHAFHMWCLWALFRSARGDNQARGMEGREDRVKEIRCPNCNGQL